MKINYNRSLPVLPLRNTHLFPGIALPVLVGRPISVEAVKRARDKTDNLIVVVTQLHDEVPTTENLPKVGVLARIKNMEGSDKQGYNVTLEPVERVRILSFESEKKLIFARAEELPDLHDANEKTEKALLESLKQIADEILELVPSNMHQLRKLVKSIDDLTLLTHLCSSNLDIPINEKQELLEMVSLKDRTLRLLDLLSKKKDELQVTNEIRSRLTHKLGKGQRDIILREQMKAIREELGESADEADKGDVYRKKIDDAQMPDEVKKTALDELKRLEAIGNASPEAHVIRNYLDLLCAMPWNTSAALDIESLDLEKARKILDDDHYGLDKI